MDGPPTITESGVLYDAQHSVKKRALRPKVIPTSFTVPRLLRVLGWLERFSPPKVLLTLVRDPQSEKTTTFSETKNTGKNRSSDSAHYHPAAENG
jgi:hypothetical protein